MQTIKLSTQNTIHEDVKQIFVHVSAFPNEMLLNQCFVYLHFLQIFSFLFFFPFFAENRRQCHASTPLTCKARPRDQRTARNSLLNAELQTLVVHIIRWRTVIMRLDS